MQALVSSWLHGTVVDINKLWDRNTKMVQFNVLFHLLIYSFGEN